MKSGRAVLCGAFFLLAVEALPAQQGTAGSAAPCADPLAVVRAFYWHNDALRFDQSAALLTADAALETWATGVNGHVMARRRLEGRKRIAAFLKEGRGLSYSLPGSPPDGPVYAETRIQVGAGAVRFMLEPDRKRPNGRLYPSFSVEAILDGCRIRFLTVIEQVTWL